MSRIVIGKIQFYKRMPMMKLSTVFGGFQGYQLPLLLKLKWEKLDHDKCEPSAKYQVCFTAEFLFCNSKI